MPRSTHTKVNTHQGQHTPRSTHTKVNTRQGQHRPRSVHTKFHPNTSFPGQHTRPTDTSPYTSVHFFPNIVSKLHRLMPALTVEMSSKTDTVHADPSTFNSTTFPDRIYHFPWHRTSEFNDTASSSPCVEGK